jgi:hypothetical protein
MTAVSESARRPLVGNSFFQRFRELRKFFKESNKGLSMGWDLTIYGPSHTFLLAMLSNGCHFSFQWPGFHSSCKIPIHVYGQAKDSWHARISGAQASRRE